MNLIGYSKGWVSGSNWIMARSGSSVMGPPPACVGVEEAAQMIDWPAYYSPRGSSVMAPEEGLGPIAHARFVAKGEQNLFSAHLRHSHLVANQCQDMDTAPGTSAVGTELAVGSGMTFAPARIFSNSSNGGTSTLAFFA